MSTRTRTQQLREQRERAAREKRVRTIVTVGIVGVSVLALVGVLVFAVVGAQRAATTSAQPMNVGAVDGYTLVVGADDAPVTLDVYQDYLCPYCGQFERANRADLATLVADSTVRVRIHPMAFLDAQSAGSRYSSRAANAAVTVAQHEPDKLLAFDAALYAQQPSEGQTGLTDDQLVEIARGVGVSAATTSLFAGESNAGFVEAATQAAFSDGVQGTPTVKINEAVFGGDLYSAGPLKAAVLAAAQQGS